MTEAFKGQEIKKFKKLYIYFFFVNLPTLQNMERHVRLASACVHIHFTRLLALMS